MSCASGLLIRDCETQARARFPSPCYGCPATTRGQPCSRPPTSSPSRRTSRPTRSPISARCAGSPASGRPQGHRPQSQGRGAGAAGLPRAHRAAADRSAGQRPAAALRPALPHPHQHRGRGHHLPRSGRLLAVGAGHRADHAEPDDSARPGAAGRGPGQADDRTISVTARRGETDYGICSTDFLEHAFRTDSYRLTHHLQRRRQLVLSDPDRVVRTRRAVQPP